VNSKYELGSALLSPNYDEEAVDGFISPDSLPPMTEVKISSNASMQLTITRSFLGVLHNLSEAFFSLASLQATAASSRHLVQVIVVGMHRISGRIMRPFLYPVSGRNQIDLPDIREGRRPYRISGQCLADPIIYFLQIRREKKFTPKINLVIRSCFV
jgi:hypothetical protein